MKPMIEKTPIAIDARFPHLSDHTPTRLAMRIARSFGVSTFGGSAESSRKRSATLTSSTPTGDFFVPSDTTGSIHSTVRGLTAPRETRLFPRKSRAAFRLLEPQHDVARLVEARSRGIAFGAGALV